MRTVARTKRDNLRRREEGCRHSRRTDGAGHYRHNPAQVNDGSLARRARASGRRSRPGPSAVLSLLAFRVALGYTPLASSYRILLARCIRRAASREKIQSCTSHRRDTFFCSVAGNGSAIVDEIFEAVDGLSGGRTRVRGATRDHLLWLARVGKRQAGEQACRKRKRV